MDRILLTLGFVALWVVLVLLMWKAGGDVPGGRPMSWGNCPRCPMISAAN